jgi:hypothetical protein
MACGLVTSCNVPSLAALDDHLVTSTAACVESVLGQCCTSLIFSAERCFYLLQHPLAFSSARGGRWCRGNLINLNEIETFRQTYTRVRVESGLDARFPCCLILIRRNVIFISAEFGMQQNLTCNIIRHTTQFGVRENINGVI